MLIDPAQLPQLDRFQLEDRQIALDTMPVVANNIVRDHRALLLDDSPPQRMLDYLKSNRLTLIGEKAFDSHDSPLSDVEACVGADYGTKDANRVPRNRKAEMGAFRGGFTAETGFREAAAAVTRTSHRKRAFGGSDTIGSFGTSTRES